MYGNTPASNYGIWLSSLLGQERTDIVKERGYHIMVPLQAWLRLLTGASDAFFKTNMYFFCHFR